MNLDRLAREYYNLVITTSPEVDGWEASFDNGRTWVAGTETDDGAWQWLVAGPSAELGSATRLTHTVEPRLRSITNPEIIIRRAPKIIVE
jgi:hypothetical protein